MYEWKWYWSITKGGAISNQVGKKIDVKFWIKIQIKPVAAQFWTYCYLSVAYIYQSYCLKYVSIITKLPILNVIYFIVLICDVKKFWHTSPSNSACCRTLNNLKQWNLIFKTWNIQRNNPFCQWSTYITTCIWRMSEQKCLQNIMWTCSYFLIHSGNISLMYLVE